MVRAILRGAAVIFLVLPCLDAAAEAPAAPSALTCRPDGTFKLLVVSDTHFGPARDERGIRLLENLLVAEKPDFVIVNGDCVTTKAGSTVEDLKAAVANVAYAMEEKRVRWAVTIGNHDGEQLAAYHITKADMMGFYERYPHNMNSGWVRGIHGVGNKQLLILDAKAGAPVFVLWLIDSNAYLPGPERAYDWIRTDEVAWYYRASEQLEAQYGRKIPGLMFFHIPLPEFREMAMSKKIIGERHEPEATSRINSGMFGAVLDRGDVRGIFCGHDHENNYLGVWHGIHLGYDGIAGFGPYPHIPKDDPANQRARGGRVFLIRTAPSVEYQTWMRFNDGSVNWESQSANYTADLLK